MWLPLLLGVVAALAGWLTVRPHHVWRARIWCLPSVAMAAWFALAARRWSGGAQWLEEGAWAPSLGLDLGLRMDALSGLFALIVCGIGACVLLYAADYLAGHPHRGRFLALLLAFQASMLGVVLADNLVLLFVFWELTSVSSYFLIGFEDEDDGARGAALQALMITSLGGLALLAGVIVLGDAAGTWRLSELAASGARLREHPHTGAGTALVLLGALTKSAQFPFHFWLPNAMAAPTPASAYLHAATMVKAGVYLLLRLSPALAEAAPWRPVLLGSGLVTLLVGGLLAFQARELKRLLALTTLGALGLLTALIGLGGAAALHAAVAYLTAHALYKACLFLAGGTVAHATHSKGFAPLGGLARAMPWTAAAAALGALSMAGVFPALGYAAKEAVLALSAPGQELGLLLAVLAALGSAGMAAAALVLVLRSFAGAPRSDAARSAHEGSWPLWAPPLLLGALSLAAGPLGGLLDRALITPAAMSAAGAKPPAHLALWHGFDLGLALGVAALAAGALLYLLRTQLEGLWRRFEEVGLRWFERAWVRVLEGSLSLGGALIEHLHAGYLRKSMRTFLVGLVLVLAWSVWSTGLGTATAFRVGVRLHELVVAVLALVGTVLAARAPSRLTAAAALGVVGYSIALQFVFFSAPDLAITQFVVETLVVTLFVLVFHNLPPLEPRSSRSQRAQDLGLAVAAGGLITAVVLRALREEPLERLHPFFVTRAETEGHGRNVVNVILTDFRALDTLGEIVVLAAAAVGVAAILRRRTPRRAPWIP